MDIGGRSNPRRDCRTHFVRSQGQMIPALKEEGIKSTVYCLQLSDK